MTKTLIGILLLAVVLLPGCANRHQQSIEQSLLLEENRRLYDALYVTHAQLEDLQHENDELREAASRVRPGDGPSALPPDGYEDEPPLIPPQITVPPPGAGSTTAPLFLDEGADHRRQTKTVQASASMPGDIRLPEFPPDSPEDESPGAGFPAWSPVR